MKKKHQQVDAADPLVSRGFFVRHGISGRYSLEDLRKLFKLSQEDVGQRSGIAQNDVSRLEKREDWLVSTLQRYAAALGGDAHVYIEIGGRKYEIGPRTKEEEADRDVLMRGLAARATARREARAAKKDKRST